MALTIYYDKSLEITGIYKDNYYANNHSVIGEKYQNRIFQKKNSGVYNQNYALDHGKIT